MKHHLINSKVVTKKMDAGQLKILKARNHRPLFKPLLIGLLLMIFFMVTANSVKAQNNALAFKVGDYVSCGTNASLNMTNNFTIEAWVYIDPLCSNISPIVGKKNAGGSGAGYAFYVNNWGTNDRKLVLETNGGNTSTTNAVIPNSTWTHVAVTVSAGIPTFYVNGAVVPRGTNNVSILTSSTIPMYMGCLGDRTYNNYRGILDEVRVWGAVRSAAQISSDRTGILTGTETNLVAYYDFNQGVAGGDNTAITTLFDKTGTNNGTLMGFTRTSGNTTSNFVGSTVGPAIPVPTISSFTPTTASTGQTVTITGTDLYGTKAVSFGGIAASSFINVNNTTVTAVVASGASGDVSLTTSGGTATLSGFTYLQSQTITFNALTNRTYGDAPFTISATGGASGNPVVFTSSDASIATCSGTNGSTITIVGAGTCTIHANQAGNATYAPATEVDQSLTIDPKGLTITGVTANNKVYDGNTTATLTVGTLNGVETGDVVTLTAGTGTFATPDVATGVVVTASGYSISGTDAGNYTVSQPTGLTADITAKALTLSGAAANDKVYDGNTDATITGSLTGIVGGDVVTLTGTGTFASANVGSGINVTSTSTLSGTNAGNYSLTQPAGLTADITAKALTVSGAAANDKVYDGNTDATITGLLTGIVGGDVVTLTGTGTFASANVGSGINVTSTSTLSGTNAGNYSLTQPAGLTADITAKALTVSGAVANDKVYDGNTDATITGSLTGIVGGDVVTLTGTGTFASANVGSGINVTSTSTLSGTNAGNYSLTQPAGLTADITAKALTVSGAAANDKVYDGNTDATITGTLTGIVGGDVVTLTGTGTFASANVGSGINVTSTSTLSGTNAGNYSITQPTGLTADITAKALTVSGIAANDKVYDGNTDATITGSLTGIVGGDVVTLTGTGTFANANVGSGINVTSTSTLSGTNAGNYSLTQPTGLSADITTKGLTITGVTANNKVYDGNTIATLTGGTLNGVVSGDVVTFTAGTGTFASANIGTSIMVTATGYALTGADAGNYTVSQPTGLSADITGKLLTITGVTVNNKVYDGNTTATLTGGTLNGVETGDLVTLTAGTGTFASANVGTAIVVTANGYSLTGANAAHYTVSQPTGLSADITAKEVTVDNTIVTTTKAYDGNTTAAVTSKGTLVGVVTLDISNLDFTVLANYNDALPGTGKTITVDYTLTGSAATNYTVTDYSISNAIIEGTIPPSLSLSANHGCSGDEINLNYTVLAGSPIEYRIVFSQAAKDQGFTDFGYTVLPSLNRSDVISFGVPASAAYGDYVAEIQMRDVVGAESVLESFSFTVNLSSDFIIAKFDDVVLCDNISGKFVSYQWYKDGLLIDGATSQYFNDLNGLDGSYYVTVVTIDGQTIHSCEKYFNTPLKKSAELTVYPNPVSVSEKFVVKINNITTEDLQGAVMNIYNTNGVLVYSTKEVKQQNDVSLSIHGEYYGVLVTRSGMKLSYKVIVIN